MIENAQNLWILTEERPKTSVLKTIFEFFAKDNEIGFFGDTIHIIPQLDKNRCFNFTYQVIGFKCAKVKEIFIKTVSGTSSFVDFLIFYQDEIPKSTDIPLYAIEETKTDDKESRNTGVYQRCAKFVYIDNFYPTTKKVMLYALQTEQKKEPTKTYIFGTRLLLTLGVTILGKKLDSNIFKPFDSIEDVIEYKKQMHKAPKNNVPILITQTNDCINISGRLYKSGYLAHDPNIGAISIIAASVRKLGWKKQIMVTQHGLSQQHIKPNNKFIQIANQLDLSLENLIIPHSKLPDEYWHYDNTGEKLGTIFIHIVVENFTESYSIFENHAGCEKGYFYTSTGEPIPLAKYSDKKAYKKGDKSKIVFIPDLVLLDLNENEAITIEGKKFKNMTTGIKELNNYGSFDSMYLKKYYPNFHIIRTLVLYGSDKEVIARIEVGFLLNENGKLILGIKAPKLFKRAINNLLDYWK